MLLPVQCLLGSMEHLIYYYTKKESTLRGTMFFNSLLNNLIIWAFLLLILTIGVWTEVVRMSQSSPPAGVVPDRIKIAIKKMGPLYTYKLQGCILYVEGEDGEWRRLRY